MSYCSITELANLTGSSLPDATLAEIIAQSDREIAGRLLRADVSVPSADDTLKAASLNLSVVAVWSHPDTGSTLKTKLGDVEVANADMTQVMSTLANRAWAGVDGYILQHGASDASRFYIRKVN